ncbi:MAG: thiol reductant ABC exporter subunit CydD [Anaerolineae bacterium]|nr:thiol reductant ABC exporter subunit CydD [Anaerolineae bacterium]
MTFNRRLFELIQKHIPAFVVTAIFSLAGGILVIFLGFLLSKIVAQVFINQNSLDQVLPLLYLMLGVVVFRVLFIWIGESSAAFLAARIKSSLREMLVRHIQKLGPSYVQGESTGGLTAAALQGVEQLDGFYSQYLPQLIIAAVLPIVIVLVVFPIDWLTALVFILTAPLIPLFMILVGKTSEKLTRRQFNALKKMSGFFLDTLQGITTLKLLNRGDDTLKKINTVSETYRQNTMDVLRLTFLSALVLEWLATLSVAVVAVEIGIRLLYARMSFEQAFFVLIIAPEFYLPLRMLGLRFHASANGVAAANKIFEVLNTPAPIFPELSNNKNGNSSELLAPFVIGFKNVNYQYAGRSLSAVNNVSFELISGGFNALVGVSGAGTSTIVNLLMGFIKPESGKIFINDRDLNDIPIEDWRSNLAWVPQRPYIFNDSIAANISLAKKNATMDEISQAVHLAHLDDLINSLPDGLHSRVGENGAKISGGQAQRIALARAFLKNAPVIILDEPTSHLDLELESFMNETLQQLCQNRTVLTIAHRLSTIVSADQILVLNNGTLVECGRHQDLMKQKQYYTGLVKSFQGNGQ